MIKLFIFTLVLSTSLANANNFEEYATCDNIDVSINHNSYDGNNLPSLSLIVTQPEFIEILKAAGVGSYNISTKDILSISFSLSEIEGNTPHTIVNGTYTSHGNGNTTLPDETEVRNFKFLLTLDAVNQNLEIEVIRYFFDGMNEDRAIGRLTGSNCKIRK